MWIVVCSPFMVKKNKDMSKHACGEDRHGENIEDGFLAWLFVINHD